MNRIDQLYMQYPLYGSRQMVRHLGRDGWSVGRHRVRRLMRLMGLQTIFQALRTSAQHPEHKVYPYLLRDIQITRPNQVWCADITYIPVQRGFLYLVTIMDWASRHVLSWRLSNSLDASYLHELEDGFTARRVIRDWFSFYNTQRPRSALDGRTPKEFYENGSSLMGHAPSMKEHKTAA